LRIINAIVLAFCVVAAGAVPRQVEVRDPHGAQVESAAHAVLTPSPVRRGGDVARPLAFVTPALSAGLTPPPRLAIALVERTPANPIASVVPTRSSRGPPRS
jgi:hypothetical protein